MRIVTVRKSAPSWNTWCSRSGARCGPLIRHLSSYHPTCTSTCRSTGAAGAAPTTRRAKHWETAVRDALTADVRRFDAWDLMPSAIGADVAGDSGAFWQGMIDHVDGCAASTKSCPISKPPGWPSKQRVGTRAAAMVIMREGSALTAGSSRDAESALGQPAQPPISRGDMRTGQPRFIIPPSTGCRQGL